MISLLRIAATPSAPRVTRGPDFDQVLPAVQQLITATMSSLDDRALQAMLDALAVANDALGAAPRDVPPAAARRTPVRLRRDG